MIDIKLKRDRLLPAAVYDLAMRLGADPDCGTDSVFLRQRGRMKTKLDSPSWMGFTATQSISTRECAFDWRANGGPAGMISVRDALTVGEAQLDVKALRLFSLAHAENSPALVRGELMRYLAELAWAPDAILHNTGLRWRIHGTDTLAVTAGSGETVSEVVLSLNSEGRIAGAFAPDRPRSATVPNLPTPWRGRFSDYRLHNGRWLPFSGEVGWNIDGQEIVYWQGQINEWQMLDSHHPVNTMM